MKEIYKLIIAGVVNSFLLLFGFFVFLYSVACGCGHYTCINYIAFLISIILYIFAGVILFISSKKKWIRIIAASLTAFFIIFSSALVYSAYQHNENYRPPPDIGVALLSNNSFNHTATFAITAVDYSDDLYWEQLQIRLINSSNGNLYNNFSLSYENDLIEEGTYFTIQTNTSDELYLTLIYQESILGSWKFSV